MIENDISIDIFAVSQSVNDIAKKARLLEKCAAAMKHNLSIAARDFTSVNFERAAEIVGNCQRRMEEAVSVMERLKKTTEELCRCAEEYLYNGFKG
jgi:propanediol dehydratase small subunit